MAEFYVLDGVGPGFDGLVIEGKLLLATGPSWPAATVEVIRLIDRNSIVGDRNVSVQIPEGTMWFAFKNCTKIDDPGVMEFDSESPYGDFQLEGRMDCGDVVVTYAQFERALQVSVLDRGTNRTVFTENFGDPSKFKAVIDLITDVLPDAEKAEDIVFNLQDMKEREGESNG